MSRLHVVIVVFAAIFLMYGLARPAAMVPLTTKGPTRPNETTTKGNRAPPTCNSTVTGPGYWTRSGFEEKSCSRPRLGVNALRSCFMGKTLLFIGNSHLRDILRDLLDNLNMDHSALLLSPHMSQRFFDKKSKLRGRLAVATP